MARDLNPICCPRCGCLASAHHGPSNSCEGVGGNCGCRLSHTQAAAEAMTKPINCPRCGCPTRLHRHAASGIELCDGRGGECPCPLSRAQAEAEYEEGRIAGKPSTEEQQSLHRAVDLAARLSDLLQEMKLGFIEDSYSHNKNSIAEEKQKFIAAVEHTVQHGAIQMFQIADLQFQFYSDKKWINDMMETLTVFEMARGMAEHIQKVAANWLIQSEGGE